MIRLNGRTTWYLMNWSTDSENGNNTPTGFQNIGFAFGLPDRLPDPQSEDAKDEAASVVEFLDLLKQDLIERYGLIDDEGL